MQSYKINLINSLVFIICGIIGFIAHYIVQGGYEQSALIPCVLGMLLLVMTPSVKNGSLIIGRTVIGLTFLFGVIVLVMLIINIGSSKVTTLMAVLLILIALSSFCSLVFYLNNWMDQKKKA